MGNVVSANLGQAPARQAQLGAGTTPRLRVAHDRSGAELTGADYFALCSCSPS